MSDTRDFGAGLRLGGIKWTTTMPGTWMFITDTEEPMATKDEIREELPRRSDVDAYACGGKSRRDELHVRHRRPHKWRVLTATATTVVGKRVYRHTCECRRCGLRAQGYWTSAAQALASGMKMGPAVLAELGVRAPRRWWRWPFRLPAALVALPLKAARIAGKAPRFAWRTAPHWAPIVGAAIIGFCAARAAEFGGLLGAPGHVQQVRDDGQDHAGLDPGAQRPLLAPATPAEVREETRKRQGDAPGEDF